MKLLEVAKRIHSKMLEGKSINPYEYRAILGDAIEDFEAERKEVIMVTCKKCGHEPCEIIRWSIIDPAHDVFKCPKCGTKQYRYEGTKYQGLEDLVYEN